MKFTRELGEDADLEDFFQALIARLIEFCNALNEIGTEEAW